LCVMPSPTIDVSDHLAWARNHARRVARGFHLRANSTDEDDLIQAAYVRLLERAKQFDPRQHTHGDLNDFFQRWVRRDILTACVREAERLKNGGFYNTIQPALKARYPVQLMSLKPYMDRDESALRYTIDDPDDFPEPPDMSEPAGSYEPHEPPSVAIGDFDTRIHVLRAELELLEASREHVLALAALCAKSEGLTAMVVSQLQQGTAKVKERDKAKPNGKPKAGKTAVGVGK